MFAFFWVARNEKKRLKKTTTSFFTCQLTRFFFFVFVRKKKFVFCLALHKEKRNSNFFYLFFFPPPNYDNWWQVGRWYGITNLVMTWWLRWVVVTKCSKCCWRHIEMVPKKLTKNIFSAIQISGTFLDLIFLLYF